MQVNVLAQVLIMSQQLLQELIINLVEKQLITSKCRIVHVELSQYLKRQQKALKD